MEVQKHPHHVMHEKRWNEYILEFFMLFLAVFLGFVAENFREHLVNKEKETHYMNNLLADLRMDSANLTDILMRQRQQNNHLDSALEIPVDRLKNVNTQDSFYHYVFSFYSLLPLFTINDNTITQLKTGGFNVMSKEKIIDSINSLYSSSKIIDFDNKFNETSYWDIAHLLQQIIHLDPPATSWQDPAMNYIPKNKPIFISFDTIKLFQLYNVMGNYRNSMITCMFRENEYMYNAMQLIAFIKREYKD